MLCLAGKESSQKSPHAAQDRLEIPILHSSRSIPARAPGAGQSQEIPGHIQGHKPDLSSWEINPGKSIQGPELQGQLGLN